MLNGRNNVPARCSVRFYLYVPYEARRNCRESRPGSLPRVRCVSAACPPRVRCVVRRLPAVCPSCVRRVPVVLSAVCPPCCPPCARRVIRCLPVAERAACAAGRLSGFSGCFPRSSPASPAILQAVSGRFPALPPPVILRRNRVRPSGRPARGAPSWWGAPCRGRGIRRRSRAGR